MLTSNCDAALPCDSSGSETLQTYPSEDTSCSKKVLLVVPEAPAPGGQAVVEAREIRAGGIRLGVLDNSKGNADHLLKFIVDSVKSSGVAVSSVVSLRKSSVSPPASSEILDQLARETDVVVSAMAD